MTTPPSRRVVGALALAIAVLLVGGVMAAAGTSTESAGAAPAASTLGAIVDHTVVDKVELAGTLHRDGQTTLVYG
ncbi:MAG: hypothetical protein M3159_09375, partial [Actinomycetota bacterium]|nr:hypothetical protein [Actinomycetota bacterium]